PPERGSPTGASFRGSMRPRARSFSRVPVQLGEVIGTGVCTRKGSVGAGPRLRLVQPIREDGKAQGRPVVALDVVSSGDGQQVFFVKGREAAQAIADPVNPADAAIVVLVDRIETSRDPA